MIMTQLGAPAIDPNKAVANHFDVPVLASTTDRQIPPPNKSNIPQPIFFSSSFHVIKPKNGAKPVISIAIIWSNFSKPRYGPI